MLPSTISLLIEVQFFTAQAILPQRDNYNNKQTTKGFYKYLHKAQFHNYYYKNTQQKSKMYVMQNADKLPQQHYT